MGKRKSIQQALLGNLDSCMQSNEILEKEYKMIIYFKIAPHKIKYLGIHLTKEVKDLYAENYKNFITIKL